MSFLRIGLSVAAIAWLSMIAGILFWNFAPNSNALGLPTRAAAYVDGQYPGSIGKRRHLMLEEATRIYRDSGADVSADIAKGTEFAPVPFLNRELERLGAKWRVRSTDGLDVKMYEIS